MEKVGKSKIFREEDLDFRRAKSSGPGGQNVNKRETSVRVMVNIDNLLLSAEDKKRLKEFIPRSYITKNNEVVMECSEERSQEKNRKRVVARLERLIRSSLKEAEVKEKEKKHKEKARKPKRRNKKISLAEKQTKKLRRETTDDLLKNLEE